MKYSEFERRERALSRACALGELPPMMATWLWWTWTKQCSSWRRN